MIGAKLKELRTKNRFTIAQLCDELQMNQNTYAKYERDERDVSTETLSKLADFYHVTTDYLLGRESSIPDPIDTLAAQYGLNLTSKAVLAAYLYMEEKERANLLALVQRFTDAASEQEKAKTAQELRRILNYEMLHINKASAGTGYDLADRDQWKSIRIYDCPEAHKATFAVEVDGDSMLPEYHDGDIVFIKEDKDVPVGVVGLFRVDGYGYIKELGDGELISYNPDYPNISLRGTDNECIGRVIGIAELPPKK